MNVTEIAKQLREAERAAYKELERGYREDAASLRRLIARPLRKAGQDLRERILSIGALDPILRRNVFTQEAEEVALRCAQHAFANADLRFRARFGMYATALANAQNRHLQRAPRRIPLPHLAELDDRTIVPQCEVSLATVDEWIDELRTALCTALEKGARRACSATGKRGLRSLARALGALHLEARKQSPRPTQRRLDH